MVCPTLFVCGSTLATAGAPPIEVTNQTPASPTAIAMANACSTRATNDPVAGSILEIEPSGSTAHTARRPTAIPLTPKVCAGASSPDGPGRRAVFVTAVDAGSTLETATVAAPRSIRPFPAEALPTQSAPSPAARSVGSPVAANVFTTLRVAGSMCVIVRSSAFRTQTPPAPNTTFPGVVPTPVYERCSPVDAPIAATSLPPRACGVPPPVTASTAAAPAASTQPPATSSPTRRRCLRPVRPEAGRADRRSGSPSGTTREGEPGGGASGSGAGAAWAAGAWSRSR